MRPEQVDADTVAAAARVAGIPVPAEDLNLLTLTMRRYEEVVAQLRGADLGDADPPLTIDPRLGW